MTNPRKYIRKRLVLRALLLVSAFCMAATRLDAQQDIPKPVYVKNPPSNVKAYVGFEKVVIDGDTILQIHLRPVWVFANKVDLRRHDRLARNIRVVYPIAQFANRKLIEMETKLADIPNKKDQEKYVKQVEKELKDAYTPIIKQLSFSQGKILIKLIDRQTGHTSYELVKNMRGNISAFFWQGLAKIFGANLKERYDREGEDRVIEQLVLLYESGLL